jgi:hypothetical protein
VGKIWEFIFVKNASAESIFEDGTIKHLQAAMTIN